MDQGLILEGFGKASAVFTWRLTWVGNQDHKLPPAHPVATFSFQQERPDHGRRILAVKQLPFTYQKLRNGTYVAEVNSPEIPYEGKIWVIALFEDIHLPKGDHQ